jgi:glycosyltransferase involved in cell wall biosynthesis
MSAESKPSFAFLVLAYNQQEYILEHLESIKYLVKTHGAGWDVDLIVNDDCSRDQTRTLVNAWLVINAQLFRHIKTIYNQKNLGTCASVNNALSHMLADRCKLTAGDDVYSYENIFELTKYGPDEAMVSGRALFLLGDELRVNRIVNGLATATQAIYKNNTLLHRFKHFSYNNAPNLLYATDCLLHPRVRAYLQQFDVVDDWPLQLSIAREFPERRLKLIDQVLLYYRRTPGSTYIVANQRFVKDKINIYDDLIQHEVRWIDRMRLTSRKFCLKSQNRWINKLLNIDFYFFSLSCACKILEIFMYRSNLKTSLHLHRRHYINIRKAALIVRKMEL